MALALLDIATAYKSSREAANNNNNNKILEKLHGLGLLQEAGFESSVSDASGQGSL